MLTLIPASGVGSGGIDTLHTDFGSPLRSLSNPSTHSARINAAAVAEEEELGAIDAGADDWFLGPRLRNLGSVHSDYWRGTAAELARRSAIGVYPIGGGGKEKPAHQRYDRAFPHALFVSLPPVNRTIYISTPVIAKLQHL